MDALVLEVRSFLPLGSRATAAIDKARDYLDTMKSMGKMPSAITLFAGDFDFVFNGVSREHVKRYKDTGTPPPRGGRAHVQRYSAAAGEG